MKFIHHIATHAWQNSAVETILGNEEVALCGLTYEEWLEDSRHYTVVASRPTCTACILVAFSKEAEGL